MIGGDYSAYRYKALIWDNIRGWDDKVLVTHSNHRLFDCYDEAIVWEQKTGEILYEKESFKLILRLYKQEKERNNKEIPKFSNIATLKDLPDCLKYSELCNPGGP